jgi:hypothetical protein
MAKYTVRVTQEEAGHYAAWIDQDGKICIKQENVPGLESKFSTAEEAQAWADAHAVELEAMYNAGLAAQAQQEALLLQAQQDSQKLTEIHAMLTQLTGGPNNPA